MNKKILNEKKISNKRKNSNKNKFKEKKFQTKINFLNENFF